MKTSLISLSAALLMILAAADAGAVTCAKGVVRAGCAGPNGAVVARKPATTAVVVAPAPRAVVVAPAAKQCAYVNGARVCR